MKTLQEIKEHLEQRMDLLIQMEKYEMCKTLKELLDKIDEFIGMKTTMKDQNYYQELEKLLVEEMGEVILKRIASKYLYT
jgi:pyruvate/2-oxoacid:ferredoxin oxidoreductase beta subunit